MGDNHPPPCLLIVFPPSLPLRIYTYNVVRPYTEGIKKIKDRSRRVKRNKGRSFSSSLEKSYAVWPVGPCDVSVQQVTNDKTELVNWVIWWGSESGWDGQGEKNERSPFRVRWKKRVGGGGREIGSWMGERKRKKKGKKNVQSTVTKARSTSLSPKCPSI